MPTFSIIVATSINGVIGRQGALPWSLPDEHDYFFRTTRGAPFIMGRKSYDSPDALLSDAGNIIITRQTTLQIGAKDQLAESPEAAVAAAAAFDHKEVFILGGETIFHHLLPVADLLYLSVIHAHLEGDAYFPAPTWSDWAFVRSYYHPPDERHRYAFDLNLYRRRH